MRLRRLQIENFRGVKALDWRHIAETAALVGSGDSGKSTILDAIERVLSPKWNVPFDDTDFWDLHTDAPIIIRATITDLAPSFYRDSKFGLLLHGFDTTSGGAIRASGDGGEQHALVVELRVDASLEPVWSVIDADDEKHTFMARDALAWLEGVLAHKDDWWLYRRECVYQLREALRHCTQDTFAELPDMVAAARTRARHRGRLTHRRTIGTPLLVKGLEFDHAVLLWEPDRLSVQGLYVALTRASKSLTIVSNSRTLVPAGT